MQGQQQTTFRRKRVPAVPATVALLFLAAGYGVLVLWLHLQRPPYRNTFAYGNGPIPLIPEWDRHAERYVASRGEMVYVDARRNHLLVWVPLEAEGRGPALPAFNRSGTRYDVVTNSSTLSIGPDNQLVLVESGRVRVQVQLSQGEALWFFERARATGSRQLPNELETWLAERLAREGE